MQKRNHSREFKLEVVRQVATGQKRPAQVCREYSLAESVLSRWRKEYHERGEACAGYLHHPLSNLDINLEIFPGLPSLRMSQRSRRIERLHLYPFRTTSLLRSPAESVCEERGYGERNLLLHSAHDDEEADAGSSSSQHLPQ
jgi:transposase-like protein